MHISCQETEIKTSNEIKTRLDQWAMSKTKDRIKLNARLCFGTYRLNRAFARFYQAVFGETGLTYPKFVILSALAEFGPLSVTELSEKAGVETNTLSPLVKRMSGFGIISRERDEKDERRVVLALTEKGRVALNLATDAVNAGFEKLELDVGEVQAAIDYMTHVEDRLANANPEPLTRVE